MLRRSTFAAVSILALAGQVFGQLTHSNIRGDTGPQPVQPQVEPSWIKFGSTVADFGRITDEAAVEQRIEFKNVGDSTLEILNFHASCGCTGSRLEGEKKTYAPGESGTVVVTYSPLGKHGPQLTTVTLTTNDPTNPTSVIQVKSQVDPIVGLEPQAIGFQSAHKLEMLSQFLVVRGLMPGFEVTEVKANAGASIFADVISKETVNVDGRDMTEVTIEVFFDGKASPGPLRGNITVMTNDTRKPQLTVPVVGNVVGDIEVSSNRWAVGNQLPAETTVETKIRLKNRAGKAFKIVKVEELNSNLANKVEYEFVPTEGSNGSEYTLVLKLKTNPSPGAMRGVLSIKSDIEDEPLITIPFFGGVRVSQ